jgi:CubicO group peptidase (beta-lactamase class C family)
VRRSGGFALLLTLVVVASGTGCAPRPPVVPSQPSVSPGDAVAASEFLTAADSLRRALGIPGLAVVVLRDTAVVLSRGLGFADVAAGVPVTPETPFNIASVTKPMSAVVALRLVEGGELDLDRRMASYRGFPEFCAAVREAGGIFFSDFACDHPSLSLRHVLSMTMNGAPGERFYYNPAAFSWASRPMAEVTGVPFSTLTDSLVLRPAGMTRSARKHRTLPLRADLAAELATPYHLDESGQWVQSPQPGPQGDGAAGGVISTAMDVARFDVALTQGSLLSDSSRQLMWTPARANSGAELPYGLGWFVRDHESERLLWHTGLWDDAYSALYLKAPGRGLTLILLANSDGLAWEQRFDEAAIERSPFVRAFLSIFK